MSEVVRPPEGAPELADVRARAGLPPLLVTLGAPASVVVVLAAWGNLVAAFLVYHVVFCLVLPYFDSRVLRRIGPGEHRKLLGLVVPLDRRWLLGGALGGVAMFAVVLGPLVFLRSLVLDSVDIPAVLAGWGVPAGAELALVAYMMIFNSGAEELFWRGWVHTRFSRREPRQRVVVLETLAFASYHVYVLFALLDDVLISAGLALGVLVGGLIWVELREASGSVVPAVVAHVGATAGYMTAYVMWFA